MKVAFINPPTLIGHMSFIHKQYPLNIMILASYLKSFGIQVHIWDFNVEQLSKESLRRKIDDWQPDIVGLTAYTSTINNADSIASFIKSYNPNIKTIIGGVHASVLRARTLEEMSHFDFLVYGEGERTLLELVEQLDGNKSLANINGICYRKDDKIVTTPPRDLIKDISTIPFPARDLIPSHLYKGNAFRGFLSQKIKTDFLITSRGCVGNCIFCASNIVYCRTLRFRSAENVLEEIKECVDRYCVEHFVIMDDNFTTLDKRLVEICNGLRKFGVSWNCFGRVNLVNEEIIQIMAESGCNGIQFGVESGSPRILELMKKGISLEQIKKAFEWSNKYGIITDATVVVGGEPSETIEDIKMTEKLLKIIKPKMFACSILIPFPGTESNRIMKEKGYIKDEKWDDYVLFGKTPPNYRTDHFSYVELRKIQNRLLRNHYLRPSFFLNILMSIRSLGELKYWIRIGVDFIKETILRVSETKTQRLDLETGK